MHAGLKSEARLRQETNPVKDGRPRNACNNCMHGRCLATSWRGGGLD